MPIYWYDTSNFYYKVMCQHMQIDSVSVIDIPSFFSCTTYDAYAFKPRVCLTHDDVYKLPTA